MTATAMLAAFTTDGYGGNPAGVVLDASAVEEQDHLALAAEVGASETAFLRNRRESADGTTVDVRFFSPGAEVTFCGHATLASAVALYDDGAPTPYIFTTPAGAVTVTTQTDAHGVRATLRSVPARVASVPDGAVREALRLLGWSSDDIDLGHPPLAAYAGSWHLVLAARTRARLADLHYDSTGMRALMDEAGWTTVHLTFAESATVHHVRGVFPAGPIREDPATGSAAAAYTMYLHTLGLADRGLPLTFHQGQDMGVPCTLHAQLSPEDDSVLVSGYTRRLGDSAP